MEPLKSLQSDPMSAVHQRPVVSVSAAPTSTTTVSSTGCESGGKNSSGETTRIKKKQSDKLEVVKKRTLMVVIMADVILLAALAYQMIWLNESLHGALEDRINELMGFYRFRYGDLFVQMNLGGSLYALNIGTTCDALFGDPAARSEMQKRFVHDLKGRHSEIELITDTNGIILTNGGPSSVIGQQFNPQNIVTDVYRLFPIMTGQMQLSVMIPRDVLAMLGTQVLDANGQYHPELESWMNMTETLFRMVLTPLYCNTTSIQGYMIIGDAVAPRQYDLMNRLASLSTSALVTVFSRTTSGSWLMTYSYNKPGSVGYPDPFPNLLPYFPGSELDRLFSSGTVQIGHMKIGDVPYTFGTYPIPGPVLGTTALTDTQLMSAEAVILHAEPETAVQRVVSTALLWHVPFGVFMCILSLVTLNYAFVRFLSPMKLLIVSVKKKKLKEFNERIRELKSNKNAIWALFGKTVIVQCVLLGLVFANRSLLTSSIEDFTSATSQGRTGAFILASKSRAIAIFLNAYAGFTSVGNAIATRNSTAAFRSDFNTRFKMFSADVMYLIGADSQVVMSTYTPSEGLAFPEPGIIDHFRNASDADQSLFITMTNWHPSYVRTFTPKIPLPGEAPAFIRLAVAPIFQSSYNDATRTLQKGRLLGAAVVVRILNGKNSHWDTIVQSFGRGYYGLYEWDRYNNKFAVVTSVLKQTVDQVQYNVDITKTYPHILDNGVLTSYETDGILIQQGLDILGQSDTLCITPYFNSDEVVLTPLMLSAYQTTGVPQDRYDALLSNQVIIQGTIMVIECVASLIALLCTYWPMKKFLDNLERAFNVPSMSYEKRQRMEERAAAMMETTKPETIRTKPDTFLTKPRTRDSTRESVEVPDNYN